MARPTISDTEKRSIILPVRVNASEKKRMEALAKEAGLPVSDLIRSRIIGSPLSTHKASPEREVLIRLLAEQNKVGSNLNQIARVLNTSLKMQEQVAIDHRLLEASLLAVVELARQIRETLQHGNKG